MKSVAPVLNFKPLADVDETHFFGGFERFVSYFMTHVKERYGTSSEVMLGMDRCSSGLLSNKMCLISLENGLGRGGISISDSSEADKASRN